jgi:hypothetical protein
MLRERPCCCFFQRTAGSVCVLGVFRAASRSEQRVYLLFQRTALGRRSRPTVGRF